MISPTKISSCRKVQPNELKEIRGLGDPQFYSIDADPAGGVIVKPTPEAGKVKPQFISFFSTIVIQIACEFWIKTSLEYDPTWIVSVDPERLNLTPTGNEGPLQWTRA